MGMGFILLGSKFTFALKFAFLSQSVLWLCAKKKRDAMKCHLPPTVLKC